MARGTQPGKVFRIDDVIEEVWNDVRRAAKAGSPIIIISELVAELRAQFPESIPTILLMGLACPTGSTLRCSQGPAHRPPPADVRGR
jgi:hypothetical protein